MDEAIIRVAGRDDPLKVRFEGPDKTFDLQTDLIRAACRTELEPRLIDLLEIAAAVFAADEAVKRGGATRQRMGQDWRRSFEFRIPVRDPDFWNQMDVRRALAEAVAFLTEDNVTFAFVQKTIAPAAQPFLDLEPSGAIFDAEEVILFSGGLDSFAGALEALATSTTQKVILLTHRSAQKAIPRQVDLGKFLAEKYKGRVLHIHVRARLAGQSASDSSQRSRSFLFAALGQVVARSFGARRLSFYENGVISHNLPISSQVVGTMATRTTHPLSLQKLNTLMQLLGASHIPIENRYCWLTKRDVVERIKQNGGEEQIPHSVSCTSIREQTTQHTHCGSCSQCLDRRFALLGAGLGEHDFDADYATDILFDPREKPQSQTMAVEWTRHALDMTTMDQRGFVTKFGTEFSRISEGHQEMSKQAVLDLCIAMHERHGKNVEQVLANVLNEKSSEILHGRLPETSLVALVLGQRGAGLDRLLAEQAPVVPRGPEIASGDEVDLVPDPDLPLRVTFGEDRGQPVISIEGLCVLTEALAAVPAELKPTFLEDRANNAPHEDYRYVAGGTLATNLSRSKPAVRQLVKRCRQAVGKSFEIVHGKELSSDRFIQSRSPKGYRLAPAIVSLRVRDS